MFKDRKKDRTKNCALNFASWSLLPEKFYLITGGGRASGGGECPLFQTEN